MPGDHSPDGPIWNLVGLSFLLAAGKEIPWQQDDVDMYAFDLDVPAGVTTLDASLDFLDSRRPGPTIDFSASSAAKLFILMWNQVALYPKGWPAADMTFNPTLTMPAVGNATALPVSEPIGQHHHVRAVPLDLLIDSPVQAGEFLRVYPLNPGSQPPHELDVASDDAWALDIPPGLIENYTRLVGEAPPSIGRITTATITSFSP